MTTNTTPTIELSLRDGKIQFNSKGINPTVRPALLAFLGRNKSDLLTLLAPKDFGGRHLSAKSTQIPAPDPILDDAQPSRTLITNAKDLPMVTQAIDDSRMVAMDLETTGLGPRADKTRLITLATDRGTYLVDCFRVDPSVLWPFLGTDRELIFHNAYFDLAFLAELGFIPTCPVHDTMILAALLAAGTWDKVGLKDCCQRYLGTAIDKTEQAGTWSGPLTQAQLDYAAKDAEVLRQLLDKLRAEIKTAGLESVAAIEQRALRGITWMAGHGVGFDRARWHALADQVKQDIERLTAELDAAAPREPGTLEGCSGWNWSSPQQVSEVLALLGYRVDGTGDDILATINHPIAELLRQHREASKKASTYGRDWVVKHVAEDGRVYPKWRQLGAASGRMSCGEPNMQQLPRDQAYRRCVVAPPGRVLIKADYSQIELRICAKVAGEKAMANAYANGKDLHIQTAALLLGKQESEVTKADRQIAKSANFGLIYGMGAPAYRDYAKTNYGVSSTIEQAQEYRRKFFNAYPGLRNWHSKSGATNNQFIDTRTLTGRRRRGVGRFTEKLNTPVQGTGADGLKIALGLLWERREQCPNAFPVLAVHDELVLEADAGQADQAAAWLKAAMLDGMAPLIDPIPCEVDVKISTTWGGE